MLYKYFTKDGEKFENSLVTLFKKIFFIEF